MFLFNRYFFRACSIILLLAGLASGVGCTGVPGPDQFKHQFIAYHDSGTYEREIERAAAKAIKHMESYQNSKQKLAVVLDIDETSISNWQDILKEDFGYNKSIWDKWADKAQAPAIKPTLELFNQAKKMGISVFFITGRRESLRDVTVKNLHYAGYSDWKNLIMVPDDANVPRIETFKTAARKKIDEEGFHIIINMGDQRSDLKGGFADRTYKLPNPFYHVS
ncbi:MAG: HAD family acid phosphatase [Candidatus Omnitrophota bacterium]